MGKKLVENWILVVLHNDLLKLGNDKPFLIISKALVRDSGFLE